MHNNDTNSTRAHDKLTEHSPRRLPGPATIGTSRHDRIHFWFTIACHILKSRTGVTKRARAFGGTTSHVFHRFRMDHRRGSFRAGSLGYHHHLPGVTAGALLLNVHRWRGSHGSLLMRQRSSRATRTPTEFAPIFLHKALRTDGRTDVFSAKEQNLSHRTHGLVREPGRTGGFLPIPQPKQNNPPTTSGARASRGASDVESGISPGGSPWRRRRLVGSRDGYAVPRPVDLASDARATSTIRVRGGRGSIHGFGLRWL
jgi:hypothetical protein